MGDKLDLVLRVCSLSSSFSLRNHSFGRLLGYNLLLTLLLTEFGLEELVNIFANDAEVEQNQYSQNTYNGESVEIIGGFDGLDVGVVSLMDPQHQDEND
jgi:hypothetical protein